MKITGRRTRGHHDNPTLFDVEAPGAEAPRLARQTDSPEVSTTRDEQSSVQLDNLVHRLHHTTDPLQRAEVATELRDIAEAAVTAAVREANQAGAPWRAIAARLGTPFQTLHRRHARDQEG